MNGLRLLSAYGERRVVGPPTCRRAFGVPPGGPFDRLAAALARALAGLPDDAPVLEIALGPVVLEADSPTLAAVVGGPDGAFPMAAGERIEVRPTGARAYVATIGSPSPDPFLSQAKGRGARILADPPRLGDAPLRVVAGPQAGILGLDAFLAGEYVVGNASDRVGVRLEGLALPHGLGLPSEPAIPGAIQVPPGGEPIVLGPDGPTIGGYPKVAVVIDADLDRLARARPGDPIGFTRVGLDEARKAGLAAREERARRCAELRVVG